MASNKLVPLWSVEMRKEAMDLLTFLWPTLSEPDRIALVDHIIAGPPPSTEVAEGDAADAKERERWDDRRVFERLAIIDRLALPTLPPAGKKKLRSLQEQYPQWRIEPGEKAHFSMWTESHWGEPTDRTPQDLEVLDGLRLAETLRASGDKREGRLSTWQEVVSRRPGRGVGLLKVLLSQPVDDDHPIWRDTLYGLREAMKRPAVARRVVDILMAAPSSILASEGLLSPLTDALEMVSKQQPIPLPLEGFLRLWDRLIASALSAPEEPSPADHDWVGRAINRPIGRLTEALLNVLFRQGLKGGEGFPLVFRNRLSNFVADDPASLRLARTILASRLLYLFAIDPDWTRANLVPRFMWTPSEDEANAVWRGYGWLARINRELWDEISAPLYDAFTPTRRVLLEDTLKRLAELLMIAGVEFGVAVVTTADARRAVRGMNNDEREEAISALHHYVAGPRTERRSPADTSEKAGRADRVWTERVWPWLQRIWPREAEAVTPGLSERFAQLAIATEERFPEAVDRLIPFMTGAPRWGIAVNQLSASNHPDDHPEATLRLIGRIVVFGDVLFTSDLRDVLDRVVAADPTLQQNPVYRSLDQPLRAAGR